LQNESPSSSSKWLLSQKSSFYWRAIYFSKKYPTAIVSAELNATWINVGIYVMPFDLFIYCRCNNSCLDRCIERIIKNYEVMFRMIKIAIKSVEKLEKNSQAWKLLRNLIFCNCIHAYFHFNFNGNPNVS